MLHGPAKQRHLRPLALREQHFSYDAASLALPIELGLWLAELAVAGPATESGTGCTSLRCRALRDTRNPSGLARPPSILDPGQLGELPTYRIGERAMTALAPVAVGAEVILLRLGRVAQELERV